MNIIKLIKKRKDPKKNPNPKQKKINIHILILKLCKLTILNT